MTLQNDLCGVRMCAVCVYVRAQATQEDTLEIKQSQTPSLSLSKMSTFHQPRKTLLFLLGNSAFSRLVTKRNQHTST